MFSICLAPLIFLFGVISAAGSDEIYSFYEKGSMPQSQLKYADSVADINLRNDMAETNEIRKPLKLCGHTVECQEAHLPLT